LNSINRLRTTKKTEAHLLHLRCNGPFANKTPACWHCLFKCFPRRYGWFPHYYVDGSREDADGSREGDVNDAALDITVILTLFPWQA
jgi:hypothetical protein